jgi:hypothetical protein
MFCPSCGSESTIELNYCNRCGANLSVSLVPPVEAPHISVTKPIMIIGAVMLMFSLGGFAGVLSSAIEVVSKAGGGDLSMAIVFFGMATILTVDVLLFCLLLKLINAALSSSKGAIKQQLQPQLQMRLTPSTTARLQPGSSVTENTTRFFESYSPARPVDPLIAKKTE